MKKIESEKLVVSLAVNCFIDADNLFMYNFNTGETKSYKDIDESDDMGNWIIQDSVQVMRDCDELEHESIDIEEVI